MWNNQARRLESHRRRLKDHLCQVVKFSVNHIQDLLSSHKFV